MATNSQPAEEEMITTDLAVCVNSELLLAFHPWTSWTSNVSVTEQMATAQSSPPEQRGDLESLEGEELERVVMELTEYASFLIRRWEEWRPPSPVPKGWDAPSLALEAISRVLEGRRRPWDPEKEPTLLAYLKSVVKSIVSSELQPAAARSPEVDGVDSAGQDMIAQAPSENPGAHDLLVVEQMKEEMLGRFQEDEDQLVLLCLFEDITRPYEIAEELGVPVEDIYRIKRKIRRRLDDFREEA